MAFAGGEGVAGGRALAAEGPPPPPTAGPGGGIGSTTQGSVVSQSQSAQAGASAIGQSQPPTPLGSETSLPSAGGSAPGTQGSPIAGASSDTGAAADTSAGTGTGAGETPALRNGQTGQVFSWNGSGWQEAGHVASSTEGTYGATRWAGGGSGQSGRGYSGHSLAGLAAWRAGHIIGRTMRLVGMGKES